MDFNECYRLATEHSSEGVIIISGDRRLFFNQRYLEMAGYSAVQELDKVSFLSILHPDDREKVGNIIKDRQSGKPAPLLYESRFLRPDGSVIHVEISSSAITFMGQPASLGYLRDISDRKKIDDKLNKAQHEWKNIFHAIGHQTVILDPRHRIIAANQAVLKTAGMSENSILGRKCYEIFHDKDSKTFPDGCPLEKLLGTNKMETVEMEMSACGGTFLVSCTPVFNDQGQLEKIIHIATDITDRKRAEEELIKSEEKFSKFYYTNPDALSISRLEDGIIMSINPAFARYMGYTENEVIGKTSIELNFWNRVEDRQRLVAGLEKDGEVVNLDACFRTKSGEIRYGLMSATIIKLNDIPLIFLITRDITYRKHAEDAVHQSEEKYRTILESIDDGYFEQGLAGNFIFLNESMCRIYGYPKEELMGMNYKQHTDKESGKKCFQVYRHIYITGEPAKVVDFAIIRKDGTRRYIESSVSLRRDSTGTPIAFKGIIRDVTERKLIENALRQSEEKYRNILESIQEGYFEIDLAGNYTFANEANCRFLGYTKEELIGMSYRQHTDEENVKKLYRPYRDLYRTGTSIESLEIESIRKDGMKMTFDTSVSLIRDSEGTPIGYRSISRDITYRKQAEEERRNLEERLQRAEKMEALGTLAGGVAHDLNNILGVIVGYSELLFNEVDKSSPIRSRLTKIMNGSEKAAAIVQDLLTLARRGVSGRKVLNLNKIIIDYQNSPELEKLSSDHSAVQIALDLEPDLLNVSGSSVHLGKAMFNLVANAVEAMPKGGELTIKTANQYLDNPIHGYDTIREGDYVVLSIADTGEGIPSTDLQRIFEPFYTKKVMGRSGTGLGLAVVWGTMKDHQGYINVQSEEGRGSTFTLYFPVTREKISMDADSVSISEYMGRGETILVVDDVREQRDLAAEMLKILSYKVSSAASGEAAIDFIKEHKIDLLVLDMIMEPGMDGLDTYMRILEIRPKQKAIIVSGFSETERVNAAHKLGAGAYVKKPYVIEKLGIAVRKELDQVQ